MSSPATSAGTSRPTSDTNNRSGEIHLLVAYDIDTTDRPGQRRLRAVAKTCEGFGLRVQKSVFELWIDHSGLIELRSALARIIDPRKDEVRVYALAPSDALVFRLGKPPGIDDLDRPVIV